MSVALELHWLFTIKPKNNVFKQYSLNFQIDMNKNEIYHDTTVVRLVFTPASRLNMDLDILVWRFCIRSLVGAQSLRRRLRLVHVSM
jgi:hypothetical protein